MSAMAIGDTSPATATASASSVVIQPPGEIFLLTQVLDDRSKVDLDFSPRACRASLLARLRVGEAMWQVTPELEMLLLRERLVGGSTAVALFRDWLVNGVVSERNFPALDLATATTPGFNRAAEHFEEQLQNNLRDQWKLGNVDYHDLVTGTGPTHAWSDVIASKETGKATGRLLTALEPPSPSLSLVHDTPVKICIGSFQGVKAFLSDFQVNSVTQSYSGNLYYELRDHFGVDDDDCEIALKGLHGTPGQVAMWVLQHHRRPGHVPWITLVKVNRAIVGSLV
jgi:hypothetical protein